MALNARDEEYARSGAVTSALRTLELECAGLTALADTLRGPGADAFCAAVDLIHQATGRAIVTGMGKSGHVGQKVAATLASTGTPAFFVHPSEASHGDLGMIRSGEDLVIALSWSGETTELTNLVQYSRRFRVPLVAITSSDDSTLARAADIVLVLPRTREACPHGLAPTTSTLMQLALGDALAIALLERKGFTAIDFKTFHPGGRLGAALSHVSDFMHRGDRLPLARVDTPMAEAVVMMTEKSLGCLGIVDGGGRLVGIVTDGDLRRHMNPKLLDSTVGDIMTSRPKTIGPDMLASQALEVLNSSAITALFVVEDARPVGLVHIHDLLRIGVA